MSKFARKFARSAKMQEYKISNESVKSLIVYTKQHSEYKAKLAKLEDNSKEAALIQGFVVRSSGEYSFSETSER
uniref:Uncharacterized protein n=1 Tax=Ditylenchus dipsaci TaxID=166011 RepID=A0A915DDM5_9BILA